MCRKVLDFAVHSPNGSLASRRFAILIKRIPRHSRSGTCRDHRFAGCQQQRSRDHRKALRSDDVHFCTKKDCSSSESTVGEVEGGTTEKGCLVADDCSIADRALWPIGQSSIGDRTPSVTIWHVARCVEQPTSIGVASSQEESTYKKCK